MWPILPLPHFALSSCCDSHRSYRSRASVPSSPRFVKSTTLPSRFARDVKSHREGPCESEGGMAKISFGMSTEYALASSSGDEKNFTCLCMSTSRVKRRDLESSPKVQCSILRSQRSSRLPSLPPFSSASTLEHFVLSAISHNTTHPFDQTSRKVDHVLRRPTDEAQGERPDLLWAQRREGVGLELHRPRLVV